MTKKEIIDLIINSEVRAEESVDLSIQQDLFSIKKKSLNEEHLKALINDYIHNLLFEYESMINLYKASAEQFLFLKLETENELNDNDRLDFISMIFEGYTDGNSNDLDEESMNEGLEQLNNLESIVFETKLLELKIEKIKELLKPVVNNENDDKKLSMNQIALKYVYENKVINRENGNDIAKKYGYKSGEKLFHKFTFYSSTANRKGKPNPVTNIRFKNKIKLIESVIELIPEKDKQRAVDEVEILKTLYKNEFE